MAITTGRRVLEAWETGVSQHPVDRALTVLRTFTGEARDALAALSAGERDRRLFALRRRLFGAVLDSFAECPACGAALEFAVNLAELDLGSEAPPSHVTIDTEEGRFVLRAPDSFDLAAAAGAKSAGAARQALLERVIVEGPAPGEAAAEAISQRLGEIDPAACVELNLECPECATEWTAPFDIEAFLWTELSAHAKRLLREVDQLARVYGWTEADILSLSPVRRQSYLEMAG